MLSWQARTFNLYSRLVIRRRSWGTTDQLARRARRVFGLPPFLQRFPLRGLEREETDAGGIQGEWLSPQRPRPGVVLYLHGGGYVACSAATHRSVTASLARILNRRVFAANYRLAPEAPFPAAFEDVVATYRWLIDSGAPDHETVIAGESAGGGLVLALARHVVDRAWRVPACVVALSPWTDLAGTGSSLETNDGHCPTFRPENIHAFARAYLAGARADDPRASPLYGDPAGYPPTLIQVGSTELLLDDARRMRDRIVSAGGQCQLTEYPNLAHGWHLLAPVLPEANDALAEVAEFVSTRLAPQKR
jgi:epsilon-lactone hydrolase